MPRKRHITPPAMRRELVTRQEKAFEKYQESGVTCYGYSSRPETEIAWLKVWGEPVPDDLIGTATRQRKRGWPSGSGGMPHS